MKEMFVPIKGYEDKYIISNYGRVISLNYNNTHKPKELKLKKNRLGYLEVKLSKNNIAKDYMVARLVAEHFNPILNIDKIVTNINNDKADCNINNLKWIYKSEAKFLMYKKGNRKIGKASNNIISYKGKAFKSYTKMAKYYGIKPGEFFKRLYRGWELDLALEIPVDKRNCGANAYMYNYYGKLMTLKQISAITGIPKKTINKRLNRGWNIYEAAEIKVGKVGNRK